MLNIYHHQLQNGLSVLLIQRKNFYSLYACLSVKTGSANEDKNNNGISHLLEHIIFSRTYALEYPFLADEINAETGEDFTTYELFSSCDQKEKTIKILADLIQEPDWQNTDLKKEKNIVAEEIKEYTDSPWEKLNNTIKKYMYPDHPLSLPVPGDINNISKLKLEDLKDWYHRTYSPNNMFLVLVGDIAKESTQKEIKKHFEGISAGKNQPPPVPELPPPYKRKRIKQADNNFSRTYFALIFPTSTPAYPYMAKIMLLHEILEQHFNPIFNKNDLYYDIDLEYPNNFYAGEFRFSGACSASNLTKIEKQTRNELDKLNITPKQFREAKEYLVNRMQIKKDNLKELGGNTLYYFLETKELKNVDDEIQVIKDTSLAEIKTMKEKIFSEENGYLFAVN